MVPWMAAAILALSRGVGAVPRIPPTNTTFGIMIDAGSSGTRAHLFQWKTRRFDVLPPPLSVPATSVAWTEKVKPGISAFWQYPPAVLTTLRVLIEWVKHQLKDKREWWGYYPIYLKATAGMRELPTRQRTDLIMTVRKFLIDNQTCPFYFQEVEAARVISGEEEAAYAWTAINYASGALLKYSWGSGTAAPKHAYGSLELGGASTQIAFYDPSEDILSNLFKVQVGQQRHWNIYAHSFLHYGYNSARRRMWGALAEKKGCFKNSNLKDGRACEIKDACLPAGYVYPPYLVPPSSGGESGVVPPLAYEPAINTLIRSHSNVRKDVWDECLAQIQKPLGFVHSNDTWCSYSHRNQCSYAGVYQPRLPLQSGAFGQFFLLGNYYDIWDFIGMNSSGTLREFRDRSKAMCGLSYKQLVQYNLKSESDDQEKRVPDLPEMCFLAVYSFSMLVDGYGIALDRPLKSRDKMNYLGIQLKVGWPLGAMLFEINALPWAYEAPTAKSQDTAAQSSEQEAFSSTSRSQPKPMPETQLGMFYGSGLSFGEIGRNVASLFTVIGCVRMIFMALLLVCVGIYLAFLVSHMKVFQRSNFLRKKRGQNDLAQNPSGAQNLSGAQNPSEVQNPSVQNPSYGSFGLRL